MSDDKDKIKPGRPSGQEAGIPSDVSDAGDTRRKEEADAAASSRQHEEAVDDLPSLKDVIREQVHEGELPFSSNLTLRKILGGDILNTKAIRRQIWMILLVTFFVIFYISNRYACQQDIIRIDHLQKQLQDAKYKALSSRSQLTEKSRESNVLDRLQSNKDSVLKIASQPPYIIQVPEEDGQ